MAPFQFAMNEVYLRDGSRKVKDVLKSKREDGQYCACPPYGYRKDPKNKHRLAPDEMTAAVVLRIFEQAAAGDSSRKIALDLNRDGIIPPLKYRVLFRDEFSEERAARAVFYLKNTLELVKIGIWADRYISAIRGNAISGCSIQLQTEKQNVWKRRDLSCLAVIVIKLWFPMPVRL